MENSWAPLGCFSPDEKTFYAYDEDSSSVTAYRLDSGKSKTYELDSSVVETGHLWNFQLSEDGKSFLFVSGEQSARFCKYDFAHDEIKAQCEVQQDACGVDTDSFDMVSDGQWMSSDGKYGYLEFEEEGESTNCFKIVTFDLNSGSKVNTATIEVDRDSSREDVLPLDSASLCMPGRTGLISTEKGTVLNNGALLSKKGKIVNEPICNPQNGYTHGEKDGICSQNSTGSSVLICWKNKRGQSSSSGGASSADTVAVYNCITAGLGKKVKLSESISYGMLSDDGNYLVGKGGKNDNELMLIDLKTGTSSKTTMNRDGSAFFANDGALICCAEVTDNVARVDVYKSNIETKSTGVMSKGAKGSGSGISPVAIVAGAAVVVVVAVGGFFIVRARKASKAVATSSASAGAPVASQPMVPQAGNPQKVPSQAQQTPTTDKAPKFCASCGTPLVPGARFCPHCGAPVKR